MRAAHPLIALGLAALGCSDGSTPVSTELVVREVVWNPAQVDLGSVTALAEFEHGVVVFGDQGAAVLLGGAVVGRSTVARSWRSAAEIPAGDGTSARWVVGINGEGRLLRLRAGYDFDDITERYRLGDAPVQAVVSLGATAAAFTFADGFAIADGTTITRYDGAFPNPAGGGKLASIASSQAVRVFEPTTGRTTEYPIAGVTSVALDDRGRLAVLTASSLYLEDANGRLQAVYAMSDALHGLATSGRRVWFGVGSELAVYDGTVRRTRNANLASDARLVGSPTGDVWVSSNGRLARYADSTGVTDDQIGWERDVRPVFVRRCAACHLPGGSANLDLSRYAPWNERRTAVRRRVIVDRTMPPDMSTPLSAEEHAAIAAWVGNP